MEKVTSQIKEWSEGFGKEYTARNPLIFDEMDRLTSKQKAITRSSLNTKLRGQMDRCIIIL